MPAVTVSGEQTTEDNEDWPVTASEKFTEVPAKLAVKTAEPADTAVAVNVALVAPDGTVTDAGTVAELLPLVSATVVLDGAVVDRNTVQVAVAPGASDPGLQDKLDSVTAGCTASVVVCVAPVDVAEIVTFCALLTVVVVTVKLVLVRPAGTVTCDGTLAFPLLLLSVTGVPPDGAAETRLTVQDVLDPPVTEPGAHATEATAGCVTP